jgi:hypothetical protein
MRAFRLRPSAGDSVGTLTGDEEDVQVTFTQWLLVLAVATLVGALVTGAIAWWILFA